MMNENVITMASIIDSYMEGFDEGKNDDVEIVKYTSKNKKQRSDKERVSTRRKKAYFKSKGRMDQLNHVAHYTPEKEDHDVVMGMLRSHQLPISDPILTCGCPIGDKRRQISADQRLSEHFNDVQDEDSVLA